MRVPTISRVNGGHRMLKASVVLRFLAISLLLCLGPWGCRNIKPDHIAGTWRLTDQSRQRFLPISQQHATGEIILNADGTFVASEVPDDLLYGPPDVAEHLVTGSGVWKLISKGGMEQVHLQFNTITQGQRGNVPYGTMLNVSAGSRMSLYYFQSGDADLGRRITYEKQ